MGGGWERDGQNRDGENHSKPVSRCPVEKSQHRRGDKPCEPYEKHGEKPWRNNPPRRGYKHHTQNAGGREEDAE